MFVDWSVGCYLVIARTGTFTFVVKFIGTQCDVALANSTLNLEKQKLCFETRRSMNFTICLLLVIQPTQSSVATAPKLASQCHEIEVFPDTFLFRKRRR